MKDVKSFGFRLHTSLAVPERERSRRSADSSVLAARVMGCDESRNAQGRCRELRAAWIGSRLAALCGAFSDARPRQAS